MSKKHELPISLHPENPHYFLFRGKPTVLVTSAEHYGAVINLDFDYLPYLDRLADHKLNYTRIYPGALIEKEGDFISGNNLAPRADALLLPWARSDEPGFALGGNKFDLDTWDDSYFARLSDFIARCSERKIVVEICFFNGQYPGNWCLQALYHANNIQEEGTCDHAGFQSLRDKELVARQEAYVAKIVREANEFDNVILEICDEPGIYGTPAEEYHRWISHMIEVIKTTESSLRNIHLVAQQTEGELNGPGDFSDDDRVSVVVGQYVWNQVAGQIGGMRLLQTEYKHGKVIELNESAFYPIWYTGDREAASRVEAWEFIIGGGASYNHLNGVFTVNNPAGIERSGNNKKVLDGFMHLLDFIESFDFIRMRRDTATVVGGVPAGSFAQCLSEPGRQYAFYIHHSNLRGDKYVVCPGTYIDNIVFDLPSGAYEAEWLDPQAGNVVAQEAFRHFGGTVGFSTPPFQVDIALRLLGKALERP
jgi:hypothetical protein